jgi:hypothetical protein
MHGLSSLWLVISERHVEVDSLLDFECLDWQNSQFINIVGKDDVSAGFEVTETEVA